MSLIFHNKHYPQGVGAICRYTAVDPGVPMQRPHLDPRSSIRNVSEGGRGRGRENGGKGEEKNTGVKGLSADHNRKKYDYFEEDQQY